MKKALCLLTALFLTGCAKTETKTELSPLKVDINNEYGTAIVSFEKPKGNDLHYELLIHTVSSSDGGKTGDMIKVLTADTESIQTADHIAYYAQENDYYGPVAVQVTVYDGETPKAQGESEIIMAEECLPAEETLKIGSDIPVTDITMIQWSGSGEAYEDNYSYCLLDDGEEITVEAHSPETDSVTITSQDREIFEKALTFLEDGTIVRKHITDPDLSVLDGSESQFTVWWKDMSEVQRIRYAFVPSEEHSEPLKEYLKEIALKD